MAGEKPSQRQSKGGVTIMDVARESGVSYSTVSRALSGYMYVAESTRQRVLEAADRLGYVVNLQARSLAGGRSNLIGILVPGLDTGYVGAIARGIDKELREAGYDLILYTTHRNLHKEMQHVKAIMNGPADGLLLLLPLMQADYQVLLQERRFPYVLIDQNDPSGNSTTVQSTNEQGAYEATQYLITLGHQRIAHITGFMSLGSAKDRLEGYKKALQSNGIDIEKQYIIDGDFGEQSAYDATLDLLRLPKPPTAIFAANDQMALSAMNALRDQGLSIPDDVSVIGFDDVPEAINAYPRLTTVRQPLYEMGRVATQLLLEHINDSDLPPRTISLDTQLIIRESCKSPRAE